MGKPIWENQNNMKTKVRKTIKGENPKKGKMKQGRTKIGGKDKKGPN